MGTGFISNTLNGGNNVTIVASGSILNVSGTTITATNAAAATERLTMEIGTLPSCGATGICVSSTIPAVTPNSGTINLAGLTINVKGQVSLQASHGNVTVDKITANNGVFLRGNQVTINGNLSAPSGSVNIGDSPGVSHGAIKTTGTATLSGKFVRLSIGGSYGGLISIGAVTAADSVAIGLSAVSGGGSAINNLKTGAITAPRISVTEFGAHDVITTGPLTAVNPVGSASISIVQTVVSPGTGAITVNGNITVSGKPGGLSGGSARIGQYDLPEAATLVLEETGSAGGVHSIKVNGAISVTAGAASYSHQSANESGPFIRHQQGTGGVASVFIDAQTTQGAASVTGPITVQGPDAFAVIQAHTVSLGNITVSGTGHTVSRTTTDRNTASAASFSSGNSAGQAALAIGNTGATSYGGPTTTLKTGTINVSGKGVAEALLFGSQVSAGNITVTAAAAKGHEKQHGNLSGCSFSTLCENENSSGFYRGIGVAAMQNGTLKIGRADIVISSSHGNGFGSGVPAASIKVGTLSATGVGQAFVSLDAKNIQTQGITVAATAGTEKGSGSSVSGGNGSTVFAHTFNINGGEADIKIRSGNSGSHSSIVLTQNGGPVNTGALSAKGPTANVDIKGKTINVGGTVSVVGSGGTLTSATVVTGARGGFSTSFTGPGRPTALNLQGAASGGVNVNGNINIKGPGLVGAIIIGGAVNLHGLSGSASAVKTYVAKDTRVSTAATTLTIGSLAVVVDDVKAAAGALSFTSAADAGDVTLRSKGDVDMASRINVNGNFTVQAAGNVNGSSNGVIAHFNTVQNQVRAGNQSSGGGPSPGVLPSLTVNAASGVTITGGGSVDLTAVTVKAGKSVSLTAGKRLLIGNATLTAGSAFSATGNGGISNGTAGATITAGSAVLKASAGAIVLDGATLHIGGGNATLSAAGNISLTSATMGAGSVHMTAAGSIDLSGITLTASKTAQLIADKNIVLSGVSITTGKFIATASGTIHDGTAAGTITADAMAMEAIKNINLSSTQLNIGNGSISSVQGDSVLLEGLAAVGLSPGSPNPNGAFFAGGSVNLGGLKLTGSYLLLQGAAVSLLGPVSVPHGALVQVVPFDSAVPIDIEDAPAASSVLTLVTGPTTFGLTNQGFISLFPGATVAVGNTGETGDVTLGANGPLDIGDTNLVIFTLGSVTGLGTVTSTGIGELPALDPGAACTARHLGRDRSDDVHRSGRPD